MKTRTPRSPEGLRGAAGANNPSISIFNKNVKKWIECFNFMVLTIGWQIGLLLAPIWAWVVHHVR